MERIITRGKCGSGSLVLFLIRHVLSLESACSSRKLMSSVCIDSLIREWFYWPDEKMANFEGRQVIYAELLFTQYILCHYMHSYYVLQVCSVIIKTQVTKLFTGIRSYI